MQNYMIYYYMFEIMMYFLYLYIFIWLFSKHLVPIFITYLINDLFQS